MPDMDLGMQTFSPAFVARPRVEPILPLSRLNRFTMAGTEANVEIRSRLFAALAGAPRMTDGDWSSHTAASVQARPAGPGVAVGAAEDSSAEDADLVRAAWSGERQA